MSLKSRKQYFICVKTKIMTLHGFEVSVNLQRNGKLCISISIRTKLYTTFVYKCKKTTNYLATL